MILMGIFNYIDTFFFISLGITFILILLLVFHFKQRVADLEEKNATMFEIINNIVKKTITLDTLVESKNIPYPDLIKMDIQGCELNALKGARNVLRCCSYLILELQEVEYNEYAPQKDAVIEYLKTIGFVLFSEKFSKNPSDADYCFVNVLRTNIINNSLS